MSRDTCLIGFGNSNSGVDLCKPETISPGVARQLVTFFCFAKKKVTKEKAPPVCRPCGVPCVARLVRRLRNSRYALRQSSPTSPDQPALLGGAQGKVKRKTKIKIKTKPVVGRKAPNYQKTAWGGLGEHCLSSAAGHVLCALLGRVAQPRLLAKYRGNPAGAAHRGATSFGYFSWQDKKSD